VARVVREVGVHHDHVLGAARGGVLEAGQVRRPEAVLALAVQHLDAVELGREPVGHRARAVGRRVVHDQQAPVAGGGQLELRGRGAHDRLEVLDLVVRR
jgi:hypothetical protein